jgi:uncharacterized damage-inducible protein DinB
MYRLLLITLALFIWSAASANEPLPATSAHDSPIDTMLKRYVDYNHWANTQMTEWLARATDEMMVQEIESSFPTLRQTLLHIWNAEYLWLQVLKGESTDGGPGNNFQGSAAELREGLLRASANFLEYVQGMSEEDLRGSRGEGERALAVADIIQHCMNHSTYHRGQLITMGRQAGLDSPPRTDFIYYVRR